MTLREKIEKIEEERWKERELTIMWDKVESQDKKIEAIVETIEGIVNHLEKE